MFTLSSELSESSFLEVSSCATSAKGATAKGAAAEAAATTTKEASTQGAACGCGATAAVQVFVPVQFLDEIAVGTAISVMVGAYAQTFVFGHSTADFLHLVLVAAGAVSFLTLVQPDGKEDEADTQYHAADEDEEGGGVVVVIEV